MRGYFWAPVLALAFAMGAACGLPDDGTAPPDGAAEPDAPVVGMDGGNEATAFDTGAPDVAIENDAPAFTNYALDFSGGSYVAIGTFPIPADFTIEAWVNPTSTSGETYIVAEDKDTQGAGQFRFGIAAGLLFFLMSDAGGSTHGLYNNGYVLVTTQAIQTGKWSHVAVTKNGAAFALLVNGVYESMFTSTAPTIMYGGPPVVLRIAARVGSDGTSANGTFNGTIDEVRFWSQGRSDVEIASTMSMEIPATSGGLFAYWRFDEGTGVTTTDQKGGYPGTLVSSSMWVVSTAF